MTDLERAAAGTLLVGFDGTRLNGELEFFARAGFAGYLLFARNIENLTQTRALTDALRGLHEDALPPLLAIDHEGGRVARLQVGVEVFPPMMALGATGDLALARSAGEQMAYDLRRAGFSIDFAPVLDLAVEPRGTAIGTRAFGSDPTRVAAFAGAFAQGLASGGIVATFKHFPGHGSTVEDSHVALPRVVSSEFAFRSRDLAPFIELVPEARAVMSAHIVVQALDPDNPATLSYRLLTEVLRDELHFDGVCFTDCMQMDAIARGIGSVAGAVAAIAAGADCALISADPQLALAAAQALVCAVEDGTLACARLEEAYARVMRLRAALAPPIGMDSSAPHPGIGFTISRRAVTLVRGLAQIDPGSADVISFEGTTNDGAEGLRREHPSLCDLVPGLPELRLPLEPDADDLRHARAMLQDSGRRAVLLMRRAHIYPAQARAVTELLHVQPDALLVSLREPFDLALFPQARHAVAAYGDDSASIAGLAAVIFGDGASHGRLPVTLA